MATVARKVEADLDGTGTLNDITAYVLSVTYEWGRTDWTASEPSPGQVTLTLDNADGRFTPGNTASYIAGVRQGAFVKFGTNEPVSSPSTYRSVACWMGTPEISFPNDSAYGSVVTVVCTDALAFFSKRIMKPLVDEEVMMLGPVGYWTLSESGQGSDGESANIAGTDAPSLMGTSAGSTTAESDAWGWQNGTGPRFDGRSCLQLWPSATSAPEYSARLNMASYMPSVSYAGPLDSTSQATTIWTLSWWNNIRNIYGSPAVDGTTGGPFVYLAGNNGTSLLWRPADAQLMVMGYDGRIIQSGVTMSVGQTHFVSMTVHTFWAGVFQQHVTVRVDGGTPVGVSNSFVVNDPATSIRVGAGAAPQYLSGTGSSLTIYGLSGSVADVSLHAGLAAHEDSGINFLGEDLWQLKRGDQIYYTGQTGPYEQFSQRAARLLYYMNRPDFVGYWLGDHGDYAREGTAGQTMLAALCDVSGGYVTAVSDSGGTMWSGIRYGGYDSIPDGPLDSADVETQGLGAPNLTADTSGVAETVTVTSPRTSVTWEETGAPDVAQYVGTTVDITSASYTTAGLLALAQARAFRGRGQGLKPAEVTFNLSHIATTDNALYLNLFNGMSGTMPGTVIRLTGLPTSRFGYAYADAVIEGASETHTSEISTITLRLGPMPGYYSGWTVNPPNSSNLPFIKDGQFRAAATNMVVRSAMTNSQTTAVVGTLTTSALPAFSTSAGDYPLIIQIGSEAITVTAAPAAAGVSGSYMVQTLTITRAADSTTARAHAVGDAVQIYQPAAAGY